MNNKDAIAILKAKIAANATRRIREAVDDLSRPKILHTQYLGDRTVQQLGQEPIENAVILNNAANAIGEALMPLAKGQPLQRFDSFNQDDGLGTARRSLLDSDANRNGSGFITLRTGEQEPANDPLKGTPRGRDPLPKDYPPPYGCVPVGGGSKNCIWIPNATPPSGYQSHGSAVINAEGLELWLHCKEGIVPPENLGCTFLPPFVKWKCVDGVCTQDPSGTYATKVECEAARTLLFTGGQCVGTTYNVTFTAFRYLNSNPAIRAQLIATRSGLGAISAIYVDAVVLDGFYAVIEFSNYTLRDGFASGVADLSEWTWGVENISITGTPDNCGDKYACG